MGPNSLGTVGSKGCKGQMPVIREPALTGSCVRPACGTKTIGIPAYKMEVTNPVEPEPKPPKPPTPGPEALPSKAIAIHPLNGAVGVFTNGLTLTWLNGGGATDYSVWINGILKGRQSETSYSFAGASLLTNYTWRIDSLNEGGVTKGDTWSFQTSYESAPNPPTKAINLSPVNGALSVDALSLVPLVWANGGGALSFDVYLDGVFQGNQAGLTKSVGLFTPFSTHTWRIDSVNLDGTVVGDTWSFSMGAGLPPAPTKATIVSPTNGDTTVAPGVVALTWGNGGGATSFAVYLDGALQGTQAGTSFNTASLGAGGAHTWRIDSINAGGTTTGDTWSFTTTYHATVVAWAAQVVTNGGAAVSSATKAAMSDFCSGLDAAGLASTLLVANFFVPDNLIAACTPLFRNGHGSALWTNANFVLADLTVNGLKGNGSNKSLNTGIDMPTTVTTNSTSLIYYKHTGSTSDGHVMGVEGNVGGVVSIGYTSGDTGEVFRGWSDGARAKAANHPTPKLGYLAGVKSASNRRDIYFANSTTAHSSIANNTTNESTAPCNRTLYAFAMNSNLTIFSYTLARVSFMGIGLSLSSAQSAALYPLVQAARVALGGGYV